MKIHAGVVLVGALAIGVTACTAGTTDEASASTTDALAPCEPLDKTVPWEGCPEGATYNATSDRCERPGKRVTPICDDGYPADVDVFGWDDKTYRDQCYVRIQTPTQYLHGIAAASKCPPGSVLMAGWGPDCVVMDLSLPLCPPPPQGATVNYEGNMQCGVIRMCPKTGGTGGGKGKHPEA